MKNILNLKVKFQPSNDVEYKFTPKVNKTYTEDDCECVEYHIDPRKIFNFGVYANANIKKIYNQPISTQRPNRHNLMYMANIGLLMAPDKHMDTWMNLRIQV